MTCSTIIQIFIAVILFLTFLAAAYYAWVTRNMWKESAKQTALQLSPCIVLDYEENFLKCRNIGSSPALNIEISTLRAENPSTNELVFEVTFPLIYVLEVNEEEIIKPEIDIRDKELKAIVQAFEEQGKKFFPFFPEAARKDEYPLIIDYTNLENVPFRTSVQVKCREGKIQILSIKKMASPPKRGHLSFRRF